MKADWSVVLVMGGMVRLMFGVPVLLLVANDHLRRRSRRGKYERVKNTKWGRVVAVGAGMVGGGVLGVVKSYGDETAAMVLIGVCATALVVGIVWFRLAVSGSAASVSWIALTREAAAPAALTVAASVALFVGDRFDLPDWLRWVSSAALALVAVALACWEKPVRPRSQ
jgi:hypothetical protein